MSGSSYFFLLLTLTNIHTVNSANILMMQLVDQNKRFYMTGLTFFGAMLSGKRKDFIKSIDS